MQVQAPPGQMTERRVTRGMLGILVVGSVLVAGAAFQLYVLTEDTERFFAWTIEPPLTAAFLGAFYGTAFVLAALSARERAWARARVGVPGVLFFVWLTGLATLLHLGKFHLDSDRVETLVAAWAWFVIYMVEPPVLLAIFLYQLRVPGTDPPRVRPLPAWFRGAMAAFGAVVAMLGAVLFVVPGVSETVWAWPLTPLTARAVAAWLVAQGLVLVTAAWEDDWDRLRPVMTSNLVLGLLLATALARYPDTVDWGRPVTWVYVLAVGLVLGAGGYGSVSAFRREPDVSPAVSPRIPSPPASTGSVPGR